MSEDYEFPAKRSSAGSSDTALPGKAAIAAPFATGFPPSVLMRTQTLNIQQLTTKYDVLKVISDV